MTGPLTRFAAAWGTGDQRQAMTRACAALLAETGQSKPPVALGPVWRRLGIDLRYDGRGEGQLGAYGDHWVVRVGRGRTFGPDENLRLEAGWRRMRFTVAHEIGHVLLLRDVPASEWPRLSEPALHDEVERLCNHAAAELLMPAGTFRRDALRTGFSADGLRALYDDYLVSWSALFVRLAEAFDGGLTLWRREVRPGEGELMRVVHSFGSPGARWLPEGLSERYLTQPLVRLAMRDGRAACRPLASTHRPVPEECSAIACGLAGGRPGQTKLPVWRGAAVPEDSALHADVALLMLDPADERSWSRLRRSRPLRLSPGRPVPAPLGIALAAC